VAQRVAAHVAINICVRQRANAYAIENNPDYALEMRILHDAGRLATSSLRQLSYGLYEVD
jgi:hypothetical protein